MGIEPLEREYPAFVVPLNPAQLAQLGYIAVLWGQIDFIIDELLLFAFKIDANMRKTLIGDKQIGSRLDLLANNLAGIRPKATRAKIQRFCATLQRTKADRNTAFHGAWGRHASKTKTGVQFRVAARTSKAPKAFLFTDRFPALTADLVYSSRIGFEALCALRDWPLEAASAQLSFGLDGPDGGPPKWIQKPGVQPDPGRPPQGRSSTSPKRPPKQPPA